MSDEVFGRVRLFERVEAVGVEDEVGGKSQQI